MLSATLLGQTGLAAGMALGAIVAAVNDGLLRAGVGLSIRPRLGWKRALLLLGTGTAVRLGLAAAVTWSAYEWFGVDGVIGFAIGVSSQLVAYVAVAISSRP